MCKGFRNKKPRPLFVSLIERRPCCAITAGGLNGRVNLLTTNNKRLDPPIARFNNDVSLDGRMTSALCCRSRHLAGVSSFFISHRRETEDADQWQHGFS